MTLVQSIPLIFFQSYLTATVVLFAFGPWPWIVNNPAVLYSFLISVQIALAAGYSLCSFCAHCRTIANKPPQSASKWLKLTIAANLVFAVPTALARTGNPIPDLISGFGNPGSAYMENLLRLEVSALYYVEYARIVFGILLVPILPFSILYWKYVGSIWKILAVIAILFHSFIYISVGQNKGLADPIMTAPFFLLVAALVHRYRLKTFFFRLSFVFTIGFIVFLTYFGFTQITREGAFIDRPGVFSWGGSIAHDLSAMPESPALDRQREHVTIYAEGGLLSEDFVPDFARVTFESFTRYLGQGYQALSMSFGLETKPTYGFGNSLFVARNIDRLLDTDYFSTNSFPAALEDRKGWSASQLWHSIYPWIASDVGFIGAVVVMALLGALLSFSWTKVISELDPPFAIMLYLTLILFLYIPANNQIMQTGETASALIATVVFLFLRTLKNRFLHNGHP